LDQLVGERVKLEDEGAMNQLLDGLPESFEPFITSVGNLPDLTLSTLTGKLLHHELVHQNN
jgi:hypothetical protein